LWGNDPTRVGTNQRLRQTVINPDLAIPQHLGYRGRLNGPVDNPRSSCLSCHSTAQISTDLSRPTRGAVPPANASLTTLRLYFRNIRAGQPFDAGQLSLDYSLQLQNGIANWAQANGPSLVAAPRAAGAAGRPVFDARRGVKVEPIGRDAD
jgi:hypothetical protein